MATACLNDSGILRRRQADTERILCARPRRSLASGRLSGFAAVVIGEERGGLGAPEISVEHASMHSPQIHHHQGIERIAEARINVETKQTRIQLQVLTKQDRYTLAVAFSGGNETVNRVDRCWHGL